MGAANWPCLRVRPHGIGGVRIDGVQRMVNKSLIADRRLADAGLGQSRAQAGYFGQMEEMLGLPGSGYSIADRLSAFEG